MKILEFKNTITKKGYFYFIKSDEISSRFTRVSEYEFKQVKAYCDEIFNLFTKHKEGVKTEYYLSGKLTHGAKVFANKSYF